MQSPFVPARQGPPRSRPRAVAGAIVDGIDRVALWVGKLGVGAFGWPPAIGVGLGVGLFGLHEPRFFDGVLKRRATLQFMRPTLSAVALFTVATLLATLAAALVRRRQDGSRPLREEYAEVLRRAAFLTALPLVLVLRQSLEPGREWLMLAFIATAAALVTYSAYFWLREPRIEGRVFKKWTSRWPSPGSLAAGGAIGLAVATYAALMIRLSISNHLNLNTGRSDLGYYVSLVRESSEGRLLQCSLCGSGNYVPHFEPILLVIAALYRIYPFAQTLLVLQTVWLAAGAPAIFLLAKRATGSRSLAVALGLTYLVYPAVHGENLANFHSVTLVVPLFLWLLYFLERGAPRAYLLVLVVLLLVREDVPLALAGVGLFAVFSGSRERARLGFLTLVAAGIWAAIVVALRGPAPYAFLVELAAGHERTPSRSYRRLLGAGMLTEGPMLGVARAFALDKMDYTAKILVPLFGVPLLARGRILLVYGAALSLITVAPEAASLNFEDSSFLVPFLFMLTVAGLARLASTPRLLGAASGPRFARALAFGILFATVLCSVKLGALAENASFHAGSRPLVRSFTQKQSDLDGWFRATSRSLPKGAKVASTSRLIPHLGSVSHLYSIEDRGRADYVIANMKQRVLAKELVAEEKHGYLTRLANYAEYRLYRTAYRGMVPPPMKRLDDE